MYGEDADAAVRIRIGPCMGDGGVVDRQELEHALSGFCHKINHRLKVAEISNTRTRLATKREYRHQCACQLSVPNLKESLVETVHHRLTVHDWRQSDGAVVSALPHHHQSRTIHYN